MHAITYFPWLYERTRVPLKIGFPSHIPLKLSKERTPVRLSYSSLSWIKAVAWKAFSMTVLASMLSFQLFLLDNFTWSFQFFKFPSHLPNSFCQIPTGYISYSPALSWPPTIWSLPDHYTAVFSILTLPMAPGKANVFFLGLNLFIQWHLSIPFFI